jgi:hypothetical protein
VSDRAELRRIADQAANMAACPRLFSVTEVIDHLLEGVKVGIAILEAELASQERTGG